MSKIPDGMEENTFLFLAECEGLSGTRSGSLFRLEIFSRKNRQKRRLFRKILGIVEIFFNLTAVQIALAGASLADLAGVCALRAW